MQELRQPTEELRQPTEELRQPTEELRQPTEELRQPTEVSSWRATLAMQQPLPIGVSVPAGPDVGKN
jgi:hypothetical protein